MKKQLEDRPWWQWLIAGFVLLVTIVALFGEDDAGETGERAATVTHTVTETVPVTEERATATNTETTPTETMADAQEAVDNDQYARAIAIGAALGEADQVRGRIANRLARRARSALRGENRQRASRLLRQAATYAETQAVASAQSALRAAQAAAATARERAQAPPPPPPPAAPSCDPGYSGCVPPFPPDVDCADVAGPVQVTGSDPHGLDRDRDGVACE